MILTILLVIAGILLSAFGALAGVAFMRQAVIPWIREVVEVHVHSQLGVIETSIERVEKRLDEDLWASKEDRHEAKRLRDRATYHVRRARRELAAVELQDGELEGIAGELRLLDGEGSEQSELPGLPDSVEAAPPSEKDQMTAAFAAKWSKRYA